MRPVFIGSSLFEQRRNYSQVIIFHPYGAYVKNCSKQFFHLIPVDNLKLKKKYRRLQIYKKRYFIYFNKW